MTRPTETPVLVIEDDPALGEAVAQALRLEGFVVTLLADARPAVKLLDPGFAGVIISDVRLPGLDGIAFYGLVRAIDPDIPVIFTTGHGDVPMAVEMLKQGAADFFTKPYAMAAIIRAINLAAEKRALVLENRRLRSALGQRGGSAIIGTSPVAAALRTVIEAVAEADIDVILEGATGTGKSFCAHLLHDLGPRASRPFVALDAGLLVHHDAELILFGRDPAAGLSRIGQIERANGGTLLIDDVADIDPALRARLIAALETRTIMPSGSERPRRLDIRVIVATSGASSHTPGIGSELARRLSAVRIALTPLAARREDIAEFFRHFVAEVEAETGKSSRPIGPAEWRHIQTCEWSGNLHELRAFARAFVLGLTAFGAEPVTPATGASLQDIVSAFEKSVVEDALRKANGNVDTAATLLHTPRKTLYDKLARHALKPRDFRKELGPTSRAQRL